MKTNRAQSVRLHRLMFVNFTFQLFNTWITLCNLWRERHLCLVRWMLNFLLSAFLWRFQLRLVDALNCIDFHEIFSSVFFSRFFYKRSEMQLKITSYDSDCVYMQKSYLFSVKILLRLRCDASQKRHSSNKMAKQTVLSPWILVTYVHACCSKWFYWFSFSSLRCRPKNLLF